jgi:predicted transcriptional regulator
MVRRRSCSSFEKEDGCGVGGGSDSSNSLNDADKGEAVMVVSWNSLNDAEKGEAVVVVVVVAVSSISTISLLRLLTNFLTATTDQAVERREK